MIDRFVERLNTVNTTSARILVSVMLAGLAVVLLLVGILFRNWLPTDEQIKVLEGIGLFLGVMMGLDVAQFASKRFSDASYAAAKKGPSPVSIEPPSNVTVTTDSGETTTVTAAPTPSETVPEPPTLPRGVMPSHTEPND